MAFSDKLKELRTKANMTQKELGEKLGISARLVSYYENKVVPSDPTLLNSIALLFNVSLDYLLGDLDSQESKMHLLVKKLTDVTMHSLLKWYPLHNHSDWNDIDSWTCKFSLNVSSNKSYNENDQLVRNDTFCADYADGSYILARIQNIETGLYKTALFIYYNDTFIFCASDDNLSIVEDLFLAARNQVLGVEAYIDEFLNDDFTGEKPKLSKSKNDVPY